MKIGVCCGVNKAHIVKRLGYDYVEEKLARIATVSDSEFASTVNIYEKLDMPVYAFNGFFPSGVTVYGENSIKEVEAYAKLAFSRAKTIGGSICVLGSGTQRSIPDGMDEDIARKHFDDIIRVCGESAYKYGLKIAVEPLSRNETNLIHTVKEGADAAKRVNHPSVGALVDFFHFYKNEDTKESLFSAGELLYHAHIARPNPDRAMPTEEDIFVVKEWSDMLLHMNYKGAISVEARFGDNFDKMLEERTKYIQIFKNI